MQVPLQVAAERAISQFYYTQNRVGVRSGSAAAAQGNIGRWGLGLRHKCSGPPTLPGADPPRPLSLAG